MSTKLKEIRLLVGPHVYMSVYCPIKTSTTYRVLQNLCNRLEILYVLLYKL